MKEEADRMERCLWTIFVKYLSVPVCIGKSDKIYFSMFFGGNSDGFLFSFMHILQALRLLQ